MTFSGKLSKKYALRLGVHIPGAKDVPWAHEPPSTWVWWLLDDQNKVSSPDYKVGWGDYEESYKRIAYDRAVSFLSRHDSEEQPVPFSDMAWDSSPR